MNAIYTGCLGDYVGGTVEAHLLSRIMSTTTIPQVRWGLLSIFCILTADISVVFKQCQTHQYFR